MRQTISLIALGFFVTSCSPDSAQVRKPSVSAVATAEKNSADQQPGSGDASTDSEHDANLDTSNADSGQGDAGTESGEGIDADGGSSADGEGAGESDASSDGADTTDGIDGTDAADGGVETDGAGDDLADGMGDGMDDGTVDGMVDGMVDGEVDPDNPPPPPPPPAQVTPWRTLLKNVYRHRIAFHKFGLNRDNYLSASNDPIRRDGIILYERAGLAFEVFQRAPTAAEFPNCAPRALLRCSSGGFNQADFVHYLAYQCPSGFSAAETIGFVCSQNGADRVRYLQFRDQFSWMHSGVKRTHAAYAVLTANPGAPWQAFGNDFFMPKR